MKVSSFCRICEPCCSLQVDVEGEQVIAIEPDKAHPVNKGFACHKGINYLNIHNDPDRVNTPLRRINSKDAPAEFEPVSWDDASDDIAGKLIAIKEKYGKNAIASYRGNQLANNSTTILNLAALMQPLGVEYMFSSATQDAANKFAGSEELYGSALVHTVPDFENTDYLLCLGANPRVSHMSFVHAPDPIGQFRQVVKRGGTVKFVDPRKNESCSSNTGEALLITPDTDVYFLAAILNEIVTNIGYDQDAVAEHAKNYAEVVDFVQRYPASRVADVVGIESEQIQALASEFCAAERASIYMSTGVNMGRQGTLAYWLLNMVSLFSGNLGKAGGNVYRPGWFSLAPLAPAYEGSPWFDTELGPVRKVLDTMPGNLMPDLIEVEDNPIRALIVVAGNPLLSIAGEEQFRQAFKKLDLLVVIDIYQNATAEYADYVLPATDWLEREDINTLHLGFHVEPYAQYTPACVPPQADRKPEWWILSRLAQAMGQPSLLDQEKPNPMAMFDLMLAPIQQSIESLKELPSNTYVLPKVSPGALFTQGIQFNDKKINCFPNLFKGELNRLEALFVELAEEGGDQLKLITLRTNYMHNTWMHNVESLKRGKHVTNPLHVHPKDAQRLGLSEGDIAELSNENGKVVVPVELDEDLKIGVVALTHGWGHEQTRGMSVAKRYPGVNANLLAPVGLGSFDKISNQAHLTGINVELKKAGG